MTSLKSRIHIPEDVLYHDLNGEAVLLNLKSGKYFSLDAVGTRMWTLLAENGQLEPAFQAMLKEYNVDEQTLNRDLIALIDRLSAQGLLIVDQDSISYE